MLNKPRKKCRKNLRLLRSPTGSCCISSSVGPGSRLRTSVILRQPGLWRTWAKRTLSGAYPLNTYDISLGFWKENTKIRTKDSDRHYQECLSLMLSNVGLITSLDREVAVYYIWDFHSLNYDAGGCFNRSCKLLARSAGKWWIRWQLLIAALLYAWNQFCQLQPSITPKL